MALTLALIEGALTFAAVCWALLWAQAPAGGSLQAARLSAGLVAVCGVAIFYFHNLYDLRSPANMAASSRRLVRATALWTLVLVAVHGLIVGSHPAHRWLLQCAFAGVGVAVVVRGLATFAIASVPYVRRVLVLGDGALAQELIFEIGARPDLRHVVVGLLADDGPSPSQRCPWLGSLKDIERVIGEVRPHRILVALPSRRGLLPFKTLLDLRLRGVVVEDGAQAYERLTGKVAIESLTPTSLIFGRELRDFQLDLFLARLVSVPLSAAALILLAPLFALIAIAIKLESRGSLFFVQERVGYKGRRFSIVKFRTMHPSPQATSEWERDNQLRLTRVGRCLRRIRLDELPQLVNIVKGDMNLVGPRPHPVSNAPLFSMVMRNTPDCGAQIPYYELRAMVRPGLTGWAQVRYHYANDLEEEIEKMRYDLYYVKHRSALLDLRILLETVRVVLRGPDVAHADATAERAAPARTRPVPALRLASEDGHAPAATAGSASAAGPHAPVPFFDATHVPPRAGPSTASGPQLRTVSRAEEP